MTFKAFMENFLVVDLIGSFGTKEVKLKDTLRYLQMQGYC